MTVAISIAVFLLLLSALAATSATAIYSVGGSRIRTLVEEGFKGAAQLSDIRSRASAVQGMLFLFGAFSALLAVGLVTAAAALRWGSVGGFFALPVAALVVLLFGHVIPRAFAARRSVRVALALAPAVRRLEQFFRPVLSPLFRLEEYVARATGENGVTQEEREVREITSIGRREGVVGREENELVEKAFRLDELTAWDVMIPRVDIFAWKDSLTLEEVIGKMEDIPYSRVPVYGETVDDITGILYVREAYQQFIAGRGPTSLKELARAPFYLPGTLRLTHLLKDFQARRIHMGIVADEFGGTDGLVTLEDVLEELVGEIVDETDLPEEPLIRVSRNEFIASGALDLREINYALHVSLPLMEHRSLNGFIVEELGHVPQKGETLERHGVRIHVVDAVETQVVRARVTKLSPSDSKDSD